MIYQCGPSNDRRNLTIELPCSNSRIAVLVSGGLDSSLLCHLLQQANKNLYNKIVPVIIDKSGVDIENIQNILNFLQTDPPLIYKTFGTSNGLHLMRSAIKSIFFTENFRYIFLGVLEELNDFLVEWEPHNFKNNDWSIGPFIHLNKSHIIDLIQQLGLQKLFEITHSCATLNIGRCNHCNRCRERAWGFAQLGLTDPGAL